MRITKVYTRTGDDGTTGLVGGQKVSKRDLRIESYGTVDELNAVLGMVRSELQRSAINGDLGAQLDGWVIGIQTDLFNLGTDLATRSEDRWEGMRRVREDDVKALEDSIDAMNEGLEALEEFILPGGGAVASTLHLGRTVCRRAERRCVELAETEEVDPQSICYLNRLSDWLFVAARLAAKACGEAEQTWDRQR